MKTDVDLTGPGVAVAGAAGRRGRTARAFGAQASGTLAAGALAAGAFAVGALAVGRLAVGRARLGRVQIDDLVVRKLRVGPREEAAPHAPAAAPPSMQEAIERFFRGYVQAFNRALGEPLELDAIRASFSDCFVAAGPSGVSCSANDDGFLAALEKGYAFYRSIGMRRVELRRLIVTGIDESHALAQVAYGSSYLRAGSGNAGEVSIDFEVAYLLELREGEPRIFAFVAGDEMAAFRRHGLA